MILGAARGDAFYRVHIVYFRKLFRIVYWQVLKGCSEHLVADFFGF